MASEISEDDTLELSQELLPDGDTDGDDAIPFEPDVLLLETPVPVAGPIIAIEMRSRDRAQMMSTGRAQTMPSPPFDRLVGTEAKQDEVDEDMEPQTTLGAASSRIATVSNLDDLLRNARQTAAEFSANETRSNRSLYTVLARAYDLSIAVMQDPSGFGRILGQAGLTKQAMMPILKLVFGPDYDKTRLTKYAATLANGHRNVVPPGQFADFLDQAEGGIKGIARLERQLRKGRHDRAHPGRRIDLRPSVARRLRNLACQPLEEFSAGEEEFTLVIARRNCDGTIAALGEVPRDTALLKRAARRLLAEQPDR